MSVFQSDYQWVRLTPGGPWIPGQPAAGGMYLIHGDTKPISVSEIGPPCIPPAAADAAAMLAEAVADVAHRAAELQSARFNEQVAVALSPENLEKARQQVEDAKVAVTGATDALAAMLRSMR